MVCVLGFRIVFILIRREYIYLCGPLRLEFRLPKQFRLPEPNICIFAGLLSIGQPSLAHH